MIAINAHSSEVISFFWYFLRLRMNILLGQYYTANPIDIRWRWEHWRHMQAIRRRTE